jgi:hypothetical protein
MIDKGTGCTHRWHEPLTCQKLAANPAPSATSAAVEAAGLDLDPTPPAPPSPALPTLDVRHRHWDGTWAPCTALARMQVMAVRSGAVTLWATTTQPSARNPGGDTGLYTLRGGLESGAPADPIGDWYTRLKLEGG